jgi:hypothetical protein
LKWLGQLDLSPMDRSRRINRTAFACGEGLVRVLEKRGQKANASQVRRYLDAWSGKSFSGTSTSSSRPEVPRSGSPGRRPGPGPKQRRPMMPRPDRPKPGGEGGQGA